MVFGEAKVKPESLMGIAGNVIAVVVFVVVVVLVEATDAGQDTTLGVASMSASATGASAVGAGSAALVTVIGAVVATVKFVVALARRDINQFSAVRLTLARFLVLGLEFQLAADVLRTAISPSFEEIGKLAAIAAIRTFLSFFLERDMAEIAPHDEAVERKLSE